MGNRVGIEITAEDVKVVCVENQTERSNFLRTLKGPFTRTQINHKAGQIFQFHSKYKEFINYDWIQLQKKIQTVYQGIGGEQKIVIGVNQETKNKIDRNNSIRHVLQSLICQKFQLQHSQRTQKVLKGLKTLEANKNAYAFANSFQITQLGTFQKNYNSKKKYISDIPEEYLMVSLRNGVSAFIIQNGNVKEKLIGSIFGQKTILSILKFKYPSYSIQKLMKEAFTKGDLNNTQYFVEDIYGKNISQLALPANLLASNLAKIGKMSQGQLQKLSRYDITRALITSFAINVGMQISLYLNKENQKYCLVLSDSFHHCPYLYWSIQSIVNAFIQKSEVFFCKHAPFLGCIGSAFNCQ